MIEAPIATPQVGITLPTTHQASNQELLHSRRPSVTADSTLPREQIVGSKLQSETVTDQEESQFENPRINLERLRMPDIRDFLSSILSSDVKPQVQLEVSQVEDTPTIPAKIINSSAPIRMQRSGAGQNTNASSASQPATTSYVPS